MTNSLNCPACGTKGYNPEDEKWDDVLACPSKSCNVLRYLKDD